MTVTVDGEAHLVAIDNGDHYTSDLFRPEDNTKQMQTGYIQAILRSKQKAGKVVVTAKSATLKSGKLVVGTK